MIETKFFMKIDLKKNISLFGGAQLSTLEFFFKIFYYFNQHSSHMYYKLIKMFLTQLCWFKKEIELFCPVKHSNIRVTRWSLLMKVQKLVFRQDKTPKDTQI